MRLLNVILILVLATSVGCSKMKKKAKDVGDAASTAAKLDGEDADFIVDNDEMDNDLIAAEDNIMEKVGDMKEQALDTVEDVKDSVASVVSEPAVVPTSMSGDTGSYTVQRGETLMMIAFKLYGDYSKWRAIQNMNSGISAQGLRTGMNLKYQMPSSTFTFNPSGEPYLVRSGDTLGTISTDKYGKKSKWRSIWENNRPMIKDPNLIFAGFTIYYIPDRNVASE